MNSIAEKSFLSGPKTGCGEAAADILSVAYADPPYIGQAKKHYSHDPKCAEVDHAELIARLDSTYDGWDQEAYDADWSGSSLPATQKRTTPGVASPSANNRGGSQAFARESVRSTAWLGGAASSETLTESAQSPTLPNMEEGEAASPNGRLSNGGTALNE